MLYPGARRSDQFRAMLDLRDMAWHGHRDASVRGSWDRLAAASRRWPGTVVISQEVLAGATEAQARRAVTSMHPAQVHIVYTVRDFGRVVVSAWQEQVRSGGRRSFAKFVADLEAKGRDHRKGFWGNHDLPAVLSRWAADLPPQHVHVVTVPAAPTAPAQLWERFAAVIGVDAATVSVPDEARHQSIGAAEVKLLRDVNARLDGRLQFPLYGELVSRWVAEDLLSARGNRLQAGLGDDAYAWIRRRAEAHAAAVRERGYDVVGDLAEILPAEPRGGGSPDDVEPAAELDAAIDVIAGLLLAAAAERHHPARTFLRRAAQSTSERSDGVTGRAVRAAARIRSRS